MEGRQVGRYLCILRLTPAMGPLLQRSNSSDDGCGRSGQIAGRLVALQILVAGLATYTKVRTQLGDGESTRPGQRYKAFFSVITSVWFHGISAIYVLPMSLC